MIEDHRVALESTGQAYLEAEQRLLQRGQEVLPELQADIQQSGLLDQLVTEVIVERISGNRTVEEILAYLEDVEQFMATTPAMVPPPEGVVTYLQRHFGADAAALMAVHLVKLGDLWPEWKTQAAILYLTGVPSPAATEALARFTATTTRETTRDLAVQSLVAIGNAEMLAKLEDELAKPELAPPGRLALEQAAERIRRGERPEV
jgi:hypothetical protein